MSDANTFFASDDWQPADWLNALDRLAVTPPLEEIPVSSKMLDVVTDAPERMIEYLLFQPDIVPRCTCSGDCENTLVFEINYRHYHVEISTIGMLNVEYYTLAGHDLCKLVRDECLSLVQRLSYMSLHRTRLNKPRRDVAVFMLAVEVKDDPQHQGRFVLEVLGLLEQRGADLIVVPPPPVLEVSI